MTSMHRRALASVRRPGEAVALRAQLFKDLQHRLFGRVQERPFRNVGGLLQQLFSFGHETPFVLCS